MLHATALPSCTESQQELLHPLVLYDCGAAVTDPVPVISMLPGLNSKFAQAIAVISTVTPLSTFLYHKWHSLRVFLCYSQSMWIGE